MSNKHGACCMRTSRDAESDQSADEFAQWELREQCEEVGLGERIGRCRREPLLRLRD